VASPDTATPATAICGKPASNVERFAGELDIDNATERDALQLQVRRIARLYAVTYATAATIARVCYSVAR
jgi:hypothetical protein